MAYIKIHVLSKSTKKMTIPIRWLNVYWLLLYCKIIYQPKRNLDEYFNEWAEHAYFSMNHKGGSFIHIWFIISFESHVKFYVTNSQIYPSPFFMGKGYTFLIRCMNNAQSLLYIENFLIWMSLCAHFFLLLLFHYLIKTIIQVTQSCNK